MTRQRASWLKFVGLRDAHLIELATASEAIAKIVEEEKSSPKVRAA